MLIACLWPHWTGREESDLWSFAAVTDDPPPPISLASHDRCIIPNKPEGIEAWLNPDHTNLAAQYAILDGKLSRSIRTDWQLKQLFDVSASVSCSFVSRSAPSAYGTVSEGLMRIAGLWSASTPAINCQIAAFCVRDSVVQRRKALSPTALVFTTAAKDCRCSVTSLTAVSSIRPGNFSYVFISVGEFLTLAICGDKTTTHIF
jgi:hypothetical protein